jgi:phosphatidylserine/phosphatidylglycerophosphate/cardiolipin synthase-like enzyme
MSLTDVSDSTLERIRDGLQNSGLRAPLIRTELVAFGVTHQLDALLAALEGHSRAACLALLDAVLAERAKHDCPAPELVWTGPEAINAVARDTAVVLRELFESAKERVVLAGYSFLNVPQILGPLHEVMRARAVVAKFFVDLEQAPSSLPDPNAYAQAMLKTWVDTNWRFGPPYPEVYCDRRVLTPAPPWSSLHAKCVAVDGERAFVSSANFTGRAQERNIEVGVLLHDATFAGQLERQWVGLIGAGLVVRWRGKTGST